MFPSSEHLASKAKGKEQRMHRVAHILLVVDRGEGDHSREHLVGRVLDMFWKMIVVMLSICSEMAMRLVISTAVQLGTDSRWRSGARPNGRVQRS